MIYEVLVRQTYFSKNPINRLHFNMTGTPASVTGSFALMSALGFIDTGGVFDADTFFDTWRNAVVNDLGFREVQVAALYDVEDFYVRPFIVGVTGVQSGDAMTPVNAFGVRSARVRTDIQQGHKRFCGVSESLVGDGGYLIEAAMNGLQAICDVLNAPITYDDEGNTLTFTPVILKFQEYTTESGKSAYKKQNTLVAQEALMALGGVWSPMPTVRSQVSRQY